MDMPEKLRSMIRSMALKHNNPNRSVGIREGAEWMFKELSPLIKALQTISIRCFNPGPDANSDNCQCNGCLARKVLKEIGCTE
jgi:hypothetical protein